MRLFRCISAIALALAVALGGSGYAPVASASQAAMTDCGEMAAGPADQPMPDCPMSGMGGAVGLMCAPNCVVLPAILTLSATVPIVFGAPQRPRSDARRLAGFAVGPEPPPPKPTILS
jgi:hypothetical protein